MRIDKISITPQAATENKCSFLHLVFYIVLITLTSVALVSCGDDSNDPIGPIIPSPDDFEWTVASPSAHGFDSLALDSLTQRLASGDLGRITSLLIARDSVLVYEEYFRGHDQNDLVPIYSCTKSICAAAVGIAINEGYIPGVDVRLFDYMDGYDLFPDGLNDSLNREAITLEHLLTMTAGFNWDEMGSPYGSAENTYNQMVSTNDYIQFTLNRRVSYAPGTRWEYNTGLSGFMAVVIQNATGVPIHQYVENKIFQYIGIDTCIWRTTPTGVTMTGNGLQLRPRDMAKFGRLYSQSGKWKGASVIPSTWVEQSLAPHVQIGDGRAYGYQWWMAPVTDDNNQQFYMPYALGYGDQHIFVPPVYDLVIVITADNDQDVPPEYIPEIVTTIGNAFTP